MIKYSDCAFINVAEPAHSLEPVLGLVYMLKVSIFVFVDALYSRVFVIAVGIILYLNIVFYLSTYLWRH